MHSSTFIKSIIALAAVNSVAGHGLLTAVTGANGVSAPGFGNQNNVPRDTGSARTAEGDTPVFKQRAGPCGATKDGGNLNIATEMTKAMTATGGQVPTASADGTITMVYHQVNGDGAGPLKMEVDPTGTGNSFVAMEVGTNVPGKRGRSQTRATDMNITAKLPAGTKCSGGPNGNACLVRVQNPVGPFGGCSVVANGDAATSGTTTGTATPAAAGSAAPAAVAGTASNSTTPATGSAAPATGSEVSGIPGASSSSSASSSTTSTPAAATKEKRRLLQMRNVKGGPAWI